MSNAAPTTEPGRPDCDAAAANLSPEAIESILHDFRAWLADADAPPAAAMPTVDLFTLVSQFTALRHEVNMQTKAARAAVESNAETLRQLAAAPVAKTGDDDLRPLLKAVLDIADSLDLAHAQVERLHGTIEPLLADLRSAPTPTDPPPGFVGKLLRSLSGGAERQQSLDDRAAKGSEAAAKTSQLLAAAAEGYNLSRRRIERLLPTFDLERIPAVGQMFDPDTMEAVERVDGADRPAGEVLDEVRPGYLWKGRVLRYAQVRVSRG